MNTFRQVIKKVPVPLCGVVLAVSSLGNLFAKYSTEFHLICGSVAFSMLALVLLKCLVFPELVKDDMKNPVTASASGTFCMSLMVLSTYITSFNSRLALLMWFGAIALHVLLIVYFTIQFMLHLDIEKVFASYFIVYVGIAVAAVTAPVYNQEALGTVIFWFGFIALLAIGLLVAYRYVYYPKTPEATSPLFCICAAPVSLCLTGYLQSVSEKSLLFVWAMTCVAIALYVMVFIKALGFVKRLPFYPSFAAMTFPFVICPTALSCVIEFMEMHGHSLLSLNVLLIFEMVVAIFFVGMVVLRFMKFLMMADQSQDHCVDKMFLGKIPYKLCSDGLDEL